MKAAVLAKAGKALGLLACFLAFFGPLSAASNPPTLFKAFKTFCIDTAAEPTAVRSAMAVGAGAPQTMMPSTSRDLATTSGMIWSIVVDGETLRVRIGDLNSDFDKSHGRFTRICDISSTTWDGASLDAARHWVGVSASHAMPPGNYMMEVYDFQQDGDRRAPLPADDNVIGVLERGGKVWALGLTATVKGTDMSLEHSLPISP